MTGKLGSTIQVGRFLFKKTRFV